MIDSVYYHSASDMAKQSRGSSTRASSEERFLSDTSAVRDLLDHIAEELAREYLRLMKEATEKPEDKEDR